MAEINVERKRTSIWMWVVGLVLLALLIWALAELFDGGGDGAVNDPTVSELGLHGPVLAGAGAGLG